MNRQEVFPLIVLTGPTGVGKTALAAGLAEWLQGEIISADSRQIYRDFNLGTGKPTLQELARVKHHLVSTVSPNTRVSAAEYASMAGEVLASLATQRLPVLVVGGTGLWIRALVDGLAPTPPSDPQLRAQIEQHSREVGAAALHAELEKQDPVTARRLPPGDVFRVIRALEIIRLTGQPASVIISQPAENPRPALWLGLNRPRGELYARAERRIDQWLAEGWLEEVRRLLASGVDPKCPAFQALGYQHLVRHAQGTLAWKEAVALIKRDTRRYIKRQLTWFNANPRINWFAVHDEEQAFLAMKNWLMPRFKTGI